MPTSSIWGKSQTIQWFKENEKALTRILDIGVGSGTYIALIKEQNKICVNAEWVGVEVWDPYIEKYSLRQRYNQIISEDVRTVEFDKLGKFSIAIAGDILEHMTKQEAIILVDRILTVADHLLISIPIVYYPQGAHEGNPFEEHIKPDWSHIEMMETWKNEIKSFWNIPQSDVGLYWLSK